MPIPSIGRRESGTGTKPKEQEPAFQMIFLNIMMTCALQTVNRFGLRATDHGSWQQKSQNFIRLFLHDILAVTQINIWRRGSHRTIRRYIALH